MTQKNNTKKTFLSYELKYHQDAVLNYLIPSILSCLLYVLLFASDTSVAFRHYKDDNPIWGSLTIFLMCFPSLISYILIISSWELWPEMMAGCGRNNFLWFLLKTFQHLFYPIWAMWRYAERLFWSIEAVRAPDEDSFNEAISVVSAPRNIELYLFLQAFLQSIPQMLLQINILMRQDFLEINGETAVAEVLSFVFNLTKIAGTVAFYQRFKTQKLAGRQYPWYKPYKKINGTTVDEVDSQPKTELLPQASTVVEDIAGPSESRRSSGSYLEANPLDLKELREVVGTLRETSVIDGPKRKLYQEVSDEPDFSIKRVVMIKGLPEDDLAGKIVAFCWWSTFLLARLLAISAFYFFYPDALLWLMFAHFLIVVAFLIYDAKTDEVKRAKALFFVFIGLIYIFCIIEFKIKFKKTKFIYCGFFTLVFAENFIMCCIWWFKNVEDLHNDFWFRYIFYFVIMSTIFSFSAMLLYLNINKPEKIVVGQKVLK